MKKLLLFLVLSAGSLMAQVGASGVRYVTSAPSGSCAANPPIQIVASTGLVYTCNNGTWTNQTSGGGPPTGTAGGSLSGSYPNPGLSGLTLGQPAGANAATTLSTMKYFYADLFPASCTVASVAYTKQGDCAFYTASNYATTNSQSVMLMLGANTYQTQASWVEPTGAYVVNLQGSGQAASTVQYTGSSAIPVISRALGSPYAFMSMHDFTIDGNYVASADLDLLGLNQSYFSDITAIDVAQNETYFVRFGSGFQVNASRLQAFENSGSGLGNFTGPTTYGYVTCTPSAGSVATAQCTLTSAGTGYPSGYATASIQFNGFQNGASYQPCSGTQPIGTATIAAGVVSTWSVTTTGTSCVGTVYGTIAAVFPVTHSFQFQVSDSTFEDITAYSGTNGAIYTPTNNDNFKHMHPAGVPIGILNDGASSFHDTELDSILQYGFEFEGPACSGGSDCGVSIDSTDAYYGAKQIQAPATFYFASGATNVQFGAQASLCGGTQPPGWQEFAVQTGTIDSGIGAWPAGVSIHGNDRSCAETVGDYTPLIKSPAFNVQSLSAGPQVAYFDDFMSAANAYPVSVGSPTGSGCNTSSSTAEDQNHPGNLHIYSGTAGTGTGQACSVGSGTQTAQVVTPGSSLGWTWESVVYVTTLPGTTVGAYQEGMANTEAVSPWTTGIGFYLSSANGTANNWYCRYSSTSTNSTIAAVASTWTRLTMVNDGANVHWYVNGVEATACKTAIASMPSTTQFLAFTSVALSGTSIDQYVDYVTFQRAVTR
jgi:hypothetical protein